MKKMFTFFKTEDVIMGEAELRVDENTIEPTNKKRAFTVRSDFILPTLFFTD